MSDTHPTGLIMLTPDGAHATVPLEGVAIAATLAGGAAEVTVSQRYKNAEPRPLEALYVFPLPSDAAVCGFVAEVDGRRIEGRVEERDKAFEIYDDAMAEGHGAFLLDQERPNIFTASVGNLRPGASVTIQIRYVMALGLEGEAFRFQLPTTVSPRYTPAPTTPEVGQPDADRVNPERWLAVPYGLTLVVDIDGAPRRVESPSHPIRTVIGGADRPTRVELGQDVSALDRDFVLLVELEAAHVPTARVARGADGDRYLQVQFIPTFGDAERQAGQEVIFLVDCSGSMGGDSIAQARRAMELCIRALSERDTFDVVRFGSTFDHLFGQARALDAATLAQAVAHIARTDASLGGTEIHAPLDAILKRPVDPARARQILLLTDGQVSNESQVIELAQANAASARIFTFGIGAGVSEHLVKELARVTRGQVELIYPGERIEPKVLRHFGRLRTPTLGDIRVDWGGLEVEQAPRVTPPVFQGEAVTIMAKVRAGQATAATLRAGAHAWTVPLDLERARAGGPVPTLWARAAIRDLESDAGRHGSSQQRGTQADRDAAKRKKLVDLGRAHGLLSSATSYVAVEVRADADKTTGPAELRKIPVALTAGWGGHGSVRGGFAGAMPPGAMPTGMPMPAPAPMPKRSMPAPIAAAANAIGGLVGAVRDAFGRGGGGDADDAPPMRRARAASPAGSKDLAKGKKMARAEALEELVDGAGDAADRLYDVLLTQGPDGAFTLSPPLAAWCGDRADRVRTAAAADGEARVATAVVLFLLERDEGARRDEWRAAADKARAFLQRAGAFDAAALFA
ncbi:MAG: VWA domain-containing protein [Deltaproteobacteria bacterium]|nr:VWA domain-containing protein [Deltaproteobacteria bacterium]